MRMPTITLWNKKKKKRLIVNAADWATDLGQHKYRNYVRLKDDDNDSPVAKKRPVEIRTAPTPVVEPAKEEPTEMTEQYAPMTVEDEPPTDQPRRRGRPRTR